MSKSRDISFRDRICTPFRCRRVFPRAHAKNRIKYRKFTPLTSENVHHDLDGGAAVRRIHTDSLQAQGQDGTQADRRENDDSQRERNRDSLRQRRLERHGADEAGDRNYRRQRDGHAQFAIQELAAGVGVERAQRQAFVMTERYRREDDER